MEDTVIKLINLLVAFGGCFFIGCLFGFYNAIGSKKKKNKKSKYPKCTCKDVNECNTWCNAKELFNKDFNDGKI